MCESSGSWEGKGRGRFPAYNWWSGKRVNISEPERGLRVERKMILVSAGMRNSIHFFNPNITIW